VNNLGLWRVDPGCLAAHTRYTRFDFLRREDFMLVRTHTQITASLLGLAACLTASAAWADTESRLASGDIIVANRSIAGSELPEVTVTAVINAPPAAVWGIVDDCKRYKNTMPRISDSKETSRSGANSVCVVTVDMPMPFSDLTSISDAVSTPGPATWKRTWKLAKGTEGGDYKRNEGSWTLSAFDAEGKRTRAVYRVHVEPNVSVPNFIVRKAQESALPDMMKKIRKQLGVD
jgi:ribosome-associated toxin RatA of RatAB toxin-antitoxin module